MKQKFKGRPPRLRFVFPQREAPLYFITVNALHHEKVLDNQAVFDAFVEYAEKNAEMGRAIGKFVIMPDHIHLFACIREDARLKTFIRLLKQHISNSVKELAGIILQWQPGFFDHLIRSTESYSQKWIYVQENPVRAELVKSATEWPWQGEIVSIRRN